MRHEYKENVRKKIISTGSDLLKDGSIEEFTVRTISKKLKVSLGFVYNYFPDKESILAEIYKDSCLELLHLLQKNHRSDISQEENYINLLVLLCNFRMQNFYRYQEIYFILKDSVLESLIPVRTLMLEQLEKLELPVLKTSDALQKANRTMLALCEGIARITLGNNNLDWEQLLTFSAKNLLKSWKHMPDETTTPILEPNSVFISKKIDELFAYIDYIGKNLKVDESRHPILFTPDFKMVINGNVVVDGREHLTPHFELLLNQVSRIDLMIHEKVVGDNKVIMRYDLEKPGKSKSNVIAIFKFRDGLIYEMNEVVHSVDPSNEIDFTSR